MKTYDLGKDIFGRDEFFAWFDRCWPEPNGSPQQRSNWMFKRKTAYADWMAAEEAISRRADPTLKQVRFALSHAYKTVSVGGRPLTKTLAEALAALERLMGEKE